MGAPRGFRNGRYKHGHNNHAGQSPTYKSWDDMINRTTRPSHGSFPDYGGRGITVCERWRHSFAAFLADMGERPSRLHSLDRWPNPNGNYEPGNCRWATRLEQVRNSSKVKPVIRSDGKRYDTITDAARDVRADYAGIVKACRGQRRSAGGFGWTYHQNAGG